MNNIFMRRYNQLIKTGWQIYKTSREEKTTIYRGSHQSLWLMY
jgi:hypothetical protein